MRAGIVTHQNLESSMARDWKEKRDELAAAGILVRPGEVAAHKLQSQPEGAECS
jgi:hypothetical protein